MGLQTRYKPERVIEEQPWSVQDQDPHLVAALAAALVAYRRSVRQGNRQSPPEKTRSNWQLMSRMAQLQRRP
jgi:hypothetical protein